MYVALGDSYSAGEGIDPYFRDGYDPKTGQQGVIDNRCHRSSRGYAEWVKRPDGSKTLYALASGAGDPGSFRGTNKYGSDANVRTAGGISWADWACSGATTSNVLPASEGGTPQRQSGQRYDLRTQLDSAAGELAAANLVTITIGGNDVGFAAVVGHCAFHDCNTPAYVSQRQRIIDEVKPKLEHVYRALAARAPQARILVLGYPQPFPASRAEQSCAGLSVFLGEQNMLRSLGTRLNRVIKTAVSDVAKSVPRLQFVPVVGRFTGHEVCGNKGAWLNGISKTINPHRYGIDDESFHPTLKGQQDGYAAAINDALHVAPGTPTAPTAPPGGGLRQSAPPAAFTWIPDTPADKAVQIFPASDGWWLTVAASESNVRYAWLSPSGVTGATWQGDGLIGEGAVIAGHGGVMYASTQHQTSSSAPPEVKILRIGADGPTATKTLPEASDAISATLAYGVDGYLYVLALLPGGRQLFQLDPTTLATRHTVNVGVNNPAIVATPAGITVAEYDGSVQRIPYTAFAAAKPIRSTVVPVTHPNPPYSSRWVSLGVDGSAADMSYTGNDCATPTSQREPDGTSWTRQLDDLVAGGVPDCQAKDVDALPDGGAVYTLSGSDGVYLMWVDRQGNREALVRIAGKNVSADDPSSIVDANGLVATAFTDVYACADGPNGRCSQVKVSVYRAGTLVTTATVNGPQRRLPNPYEVGRPQLAIGKGQVLVEVVNDARGEVSGGREYSTMLAPVVPSRHPSFTSR